MREFHPPNPRIVATITAISWLVIWVAALVTLAWSGSSGIPFERILAWLLVIASPLIAWNQFKSHWT